MIILLIQSVTRKSHAFVCYIVDTILHLSSRFGTALDWFNSYLSAFFFRLMLLACRQPSCLWCSQGFVLDPRLSNMHTIHLVTIILSSSPVITCMTMTANVISFVPNNFITHVSQLQDTISTLSLWTSSNLLSLSHSLSQSIKN